MSETLASNGYIATFVSNAIVPVELPTQNCFRDAEQWVNEKRNEVALIEVIVNRAGVERTVLATPDMTVFKFTDKMLMTHRIESRDFIFNIDDYRVLSTPLIPEKFDIIKEDVGGTRFTYQVTPFNNEPVFKFTGAYRTGYRVHTKLIKQETI